MTGFIVSALIAYLLGSIPFGLILTAIGGGGDIRKVGSGNIGATNVLRTGRKGLAAATLALDALKGALAVAAGGLIGDALGSRDADFAAAALFAVIGHCYPFWLRFKGGKGVATGLGAGAALNWKAALACCVIWLVVARLSRISSAGALAAFAAAPVVFLLLRPAGEPTATGPAIPLAVVAITLLIWARHRGNIARLIAGTEPRIGETRSPAGKSPEGKSPAED